MGFRSLRVSDLSGIELSDSEVVTVVVKNHGKVFDCHPDELKTLKGVSNVEELELRYPNGESKTLLVTQAEFGKVIPADKLEGFDSSRGRRSGFSPKTNGASLIRSIQAQ